MQAAIEIVHPSRSLHGRILEVDSHTMAAPFGDEGVQQFFVRSRP